jgi:hypothetical protein
MLAEHPKTRKPLRSHKARSLSPHPITSPSLLPVEVRDLRKIDDGGDDKVLQSIADKKQGESDNDYYQREINDSQIAFIDPHRGKGDSPDMPNLAARIPNGPDSVKVKWRLEVEYLRGNGYRTDYSKAAYKIKEIVKVPSAGENGESTYTDEKGANQEWKMFEHADWIKEITDKGFFGGTAKVYMWLSTEEEPTKPIITFRIGGKNPEEVKAKAFIVKVVKEKDNRLWFSYAIAKSETFSRVRENGNIRYYNQFYTDYKGGPIGDKSKDMGWAGWAKSWPIYNFDRYYNKKTKKRVQNGPGGYGVYQITGGIKDSKIVIDRKIIWNWQENVRTGIDLIKSKADWVEKRHPKLTITYPKSGTLPTYPLGYTGNKKSLSSWDAYTVTAYNGLAGGGIKKIKLKGFKSSQRTCWKPDEKNKKWLFGENMNQYVKKIFNRIEE